VAVYYCLPQDIRDNVGGTDNGTGTCAQLTDEQLTEAIGRASSKVSAYAGTTFEPDASQPVVTVPALIVTLTVQIATYYATLTYRKSKDLAAFDPVYLGFLDASQMLKDIASGLIQVAPPDPGEPSPDAVPAKVINTTPRAFTYEDSGTVPDGRGGIMPAGAPGSALRDGWW
jgi:phage gp36-like protein